jgi:hypothetical protein
MQQPDMAFTGSQFHEPSQQPSYERCAFADDLPASIHPSTQHLADTGFGPIPEMGDMPVKSEWRLWLILGVLLAMWIALLRWVLSVPWGAFLHWVLS